MNITEILQQHAGQFPDEIAIIDRVGGEVGVPRTEVEPEFDGGL